MLPSELLERRPDIAANERRVAAANAQIGVTIAAYYPNVTLSASGGLESSSLLSLFTWPSRFWSLGPSLTETLYDAGAPQGVTEEAQAAYDVAVANYRESVLTAFQKVEDNLATLRILEQESREQARAVRYADRSLTARQRAVSGRHHDVSAGDHGAGSGAAERTDGGADQHAPHDRQRVADSGAGRRMGCFASCHRPKT